MRDNYDYIRFVYGTPIQRYTRDALLTAQAQAIARSNASHARFAVEADGYAFRVVANRYSVCVDPDRDEYSINSQLEIIAFPIIKRTPTGFRIWRGHNGRCDETRFISRKWNKAWASETAEGALRDFIARKQRQAAIYENKAHVARHEGVMAEVVLPRSQQKD